jgi:hypothetical protein
VPAEIIQCFSAFLDFCYIARRHAITSKALVKMESLLQEFHEARNFFLDNDVLSKVVAPRQHALTHYARGIRLFGALNGLCSSITESKHIVAVKKPWRQSSRNAPIFQMMLRITRLEKLAGLTAYLSSLQLTWGTTSQFMQDWLAKLHGDETSDAEEVGLTPLVYDSDSDDDDNGATVASDAGSIIHRHNTGRTRTASAEEDEAAADDKSLEGVGITTITSSVKLSQTHGTYSFIHYHSCIDIILVHRYPKALNSLAAYIEQPKFPYALRLFLYRYNFPHSNIIPEPEDLPLFEGDIKVHHSAIARYYAPSDLCGKGGIHRQTIRSNPSWFKKNGICLPRYDTVFVSVNDQPGMEGMEIGQVLLFFSFRYHRRDWECALVMWYPKRDDAADPDTKMWIVEPEVDEVGAPVVEVVSLDAISRAAHLLPVYGEGLLPKTYDYRLALDLFDAYFVSPYADHHANEFLKDY